MHITLLVLDLARDRVTGPKPDDRIKKKIYHRTINKKTRLPNYYLPNIPFIIEVKVILG